MSSLFNRLAKAGEERRRRPTPAGKPRLCVLSRGAERTNAFGTYYWIEERRRQPLEIPALLHSGAAANLQLVRGVGPVYEEKLRRSGYRSLYDLMEHPVFGKDAAEVVERLECKDLASLRHRGACDGELFCQIEDARIVFLDIETTGLWSNQPLFLVGMLSQDGEEMVLHQYLARTFDEEQALLAAVQEEAEASNVLVTFNGKNFDVPYLEGRMVEHRLFYRFRHFHIDLLWHARRHYRDYLPNCRLGTLEQYVLGFERQDDVPGSLVPEYYHRFSVSQDPRWIDGILTHNAWDLFNLARLLPLINKAPLPIVGQKNHYTAPKEIR